MTTTEFNAWHVDNDGSDTDELLFWRRSVVKLHAIPYEGQAYFYDSTALERELLRSADANIEAHVYAL